MSLDQKRARVFGVLYLITFVTSIPALALYQPVLDDPVGYISAAGHDTQILFAALLELLLIIANIGTAVVIFPIVRRQNEELALGYVTARVIECTFILVGILSVLGIITLTQQVAGANEGTVAYTLAGIKDWTFLLGPGWVVGWGNGLILGYLMYRSELVPRAACWLGFIGGTLLIARASPWSASSWRTSHGVGWAGLPPASGPMAPSRRCVTSGRTSFRPVSDAVSTARRRPGRKRA